MKTEDLHTVYTLYTVGTNSKTTHVVIQAMYLAYVSSLRYRMLTNTVQGCRLAPLISKLHTKA